MHSLRASFGDQLQPDVFPLEPQTLDLCLALDVNHLFNSSHRPRALQPQETKLPARESKKDLQKRVVCFFNIFTRNFIHILLHKDFGKSAQNKRGYINTLVPLASCYSSARLLFELPSSRALETDKLTTLHCYMVEDLPEKQLKLHRLLACHFRVFYRNILQTCVYYARRGARSSAIDTK